MTDLDPDLARLVAEHAAGGDAAARRAAVRVLHEAGRVTTARARLAAARLLVDGDRVGDVELAQTLALAAMPHEPAARRLAAEAFDRLRRLAGQPQKFGTQVVLHDGVGELWPVDAATTDSERAKWDVEPLTELRRRATMPR